MTQCFVVSGLHVKVTAAWIISRCNDIHHLHAEFHQNTSLYVCKIEPADGYIYIQTNAACKIPSKGTLQNVSWLWRYELYWVTSKTNIFFVVNMRSCFGINISLLRTVLCAGWYDVGISCGRMYVLVKEYALCSYCTHGDFTLKISILNLQEQSCQQILIGEIWNLLKQV